MFKKQLVSTGIILALLGSNIITENQYIQDSKENESRIKNQRYLIEQSKVKINQYEINKGKNEQTIKEKEMEINTLHKQLDKVKQEKSKVEKELASRGEKVNSKTYFEVTAYTANQESTGKTSSDKGYGITASGIRVKEGRTIACPPSLKFGTKLNIEAIGLRVCEDRGAAIKYGHLDLYMESLSKAILFGRQTLLVEIIR